MDQFIKKFLSEKDYEGSTELCTIMKCHGSDKGLGHHNYTTFYEPLLKHLKTTTDVVVFELGIGTNNPNLPSSMGVDGRPGASLRGWEEWLPNAHIIGADIDRDILFTTERITTYYVDQKNATTITDMWSKCKQPVDLIVDDGLHQFFANDIFIRNSHMYLKPGGIYIIEDITNNDIISFKTSIPEYKQWFEEVYIITIPNINNNFDNTILVCKKSGIEY